MALNKYYRGDDIKLPIFGLEDDGTTPLNIDNLLDIIIRIWISPQQILLFSKSLKTDYTQLMKESSTKYWLIIEGATTKTMKLGDINIDAMVIVTDTQMSDDRLNVSSVTKLGTLCDNLNKSEL
jgi:hypothetical protein